MTMDELNAIYNNMSVYGDTYTSPTTTIPKDPNAGKPPILEPFIPIVKQLGTPYNDNDNKIAAANNNIDYNNLIVRDQSTSTGIDSNTSGVTSSYNITPVTKEEFAKNRALNSRFVDYNDYFKQTIAQGQFQQTQPQKTGILEKLKNFDFSKMPSIAFAKALLPEQDPRATATRNFYDDNFGLTSSGSVASGIMKDYNPVSGGFLNMITGGKFGDETQYGLGPAMDKRMDNIKNMLGSKYGYSYTNDNQMYKDMLDGKIGGYGIKGHTSAAENYFKIKSIRDKEKIALQAQEKIKADKADKIYKKKLEADAITMAANTKNPDGSTASYNYPGRDNKHGTHTSTKTKEEAATNQDSGRGQQTSAPSKTAPSRSSSYSSSRGSNFGSRFHGAKGGKVRRSYFDGGIVSL